MLRKRSLPSGSRSTRPLRRAHRPASAAPRRGAPRPAGIVECDAEHRRVPQHDPVGGREPVDVRSHDRLDRVGQRLDRPVRARDVQQLDQEERASPRPPHDLLDLVRAQRLLVGRELDQLCGVVLGERQERAGEAALAFLLLVVLSQIGESRVSLTISAYGIERVARESRCRRSELASSMN